MNGHHPRGSKGFYPPPGYLTSTTRSLQPSAAHSLQPPPAHGLMPPPYESQSGPLSPDLPYSPPNPGPERSVPSYPDDGTGRCYPPHRYTGSQSGPPASGSDTGRCYSPRYTPQNTVSRQAVIPRRQDLSPSTSYNLYTTPHATSLPAQVTSQSGPPPASLPPPNPGPLKQSGPPFVDPPTGGTRRHSSLLSMMRYVNEFLRGCRTSIDLILLFADTGLSFSAFIGSMFSKFFQRQPVHVRISAETWVVGIIVGVVKLAGWVTHVTTQRSMFD